MVATKWIRRAALAAAILSALVLTGCERRPDKAQDSGVILGFSQRWRLGNSRDIARRRSARASS